MLTPPTRLAVVTWLAGCLGALGCFGAPGHEGPRTSHLDGDTFHNVPEVSRPGPLEVLGWMFAVPNEAIRWPAVFAAIRERLGPPTVALLPIGAYEPRWFMENIHMSPADAVRAHQALAARRSIGIHWAPSISPTRAASSRRAICSWRCAMHACRSGTSSPPGTARASRSKAASASSPAPP